MTIKPRALRRVLRSVFHEELGHSMDETEELVDLVFNELDADEIDLEGVEERYEDDDDFHDEG